MIQIRKNTFETNSSSTHSLVMCTKDTYKQFSDGTLFYVDSSRLNDSEKFCTLEEVIELIKNKKIYCSDEMCSDIIELRDKGNFEAMEDYLRDWDIYTLNTWEDHEYEEFYEEFNTPSGETVVAFGYYGASY